jgi:hypothetical protein
MRVTFHVPIGPVTWRIAADLDQGNGDRNDLAEEPELDLRFGVCSDGRELTGLALDYEMEQAGVSLATLLRLARMARGRQCIEDAARAVAP